MVLENPWYLISFLGDPRLWTALCIVLFVAVMLSKNKKPNRLNLVPVFILFAGFGMAGAFGLSELLKNLFQVPRECVLLGGLNPYCIDTFAFPSGHTTIAFAAFTGMFLMVKKWKYIWIYIFPLLVGFSRIALGVHNYFDVVGGIITGILFVILYTEILKRVKFFKKWLGNLSSIRL